MCLMSPSPVMSQSPTPWRTVRQDHLWVATFIDQPVTARWAFLGDVQWRRTDAGRDPQQLLTRGSLTYRVTPGFRLGAGVNVGAGTITANYDGERKHRTVVGAGSKTGANSVLVAPLHLGQNVTVGAGSTITRDVPDNALALGRARQLVKDNWRAARP